MSNGSSSLCIAALFLLAAASSAAAAEPAGIHFTADQRVDGLPGTPSQSLAIEGWAVAGSVRIEMPNDTFLLERDGGKNLYLCNRKEKSYWRMDQQAGLRNLGAALGVHDPKLEKLLDEPGGPILGQATRHTRYRISYQIAGTLPGMPPMDSTIDKEVWSAPGLPETGFDAWLATGDLSSGNPEFERLLAGMRETMKGLPLRVKIVNTMTLKTPDGKTETPQAMHLEVVVTSLETVSVDPSRFAIPEGYKEVELPKGPGARARPGEQR